MRHNVMWQKSVSDSEGTAACILQSTFPLTHFPLTHFHRVCLFRQSSTATRRSSSTPNWFTNYSQSVLISNSFWAFDHIVSQFGAFNPRLLLPDGTNKRCLLAWGKTSRNARPAKANLACNFIATELYSKRAKYNKGKSVPLQAWREPECSRKLSFQDFVTKAQGGGNFVSLTHRPHLPSGISPGTHFCQGLSRPQGHSATGRIMPMKNYNDIIWNRTSDLPICSTAP